MTQSGTPCIVVSVEAITPRQNTKIGNNMKASFNVGDVVKLASGGPKMTVVASGEQLTVAYFNGSALETHTGIPAAAIRHACDDSAAYWGLLRSALLELGHSEEEAKIAFRKGEPGM